MLSKNQIKLIKSLAQKKYRQQLGLFVVEGVKGIEEFLNSEAMLHSVYATQSIFRVPKTVLFEISEVELKKMSALKNPNKALAVFYKPEPKDVDKNGLIVALDAIRDPGNLGTIIRLCDWYGIKNLICSSSTVDCFNPKVVQATMGSLTRVNVVYLNLEHFISDYSGVVFGTYMNGDHIYTTALPDSGIIILGNEANGISESISKHVSRRLTIPQFGTHKKTESLNVAVATAIVLSEFKRRSIEM